MYLHFDKNGGTFYRKRRYVFIKMEVRFFEFTYRNTKLRPSGSKIFT